ncbi:UDP-N-acetylglucosamine 2-epimerase [Aliarcobacter butzleri]|uniref:UDP-N-acetylglucosamine 2-epimerase n=1 Tax=Aliarcobacter butzleri TaxID=28197 RepID=UPI0021B16B98|nr:UDP-N-acetylglucosamine 2-epimerase [Aliarcobacter butzleri]MCT7556043.1 UDP-N-acetylglucosamine 2-epimerase [Aliarcobacter butzleri]
MDKKRIVFLTGTRADFGKLKSLIKITQNSELFDVHIFVTGMHMITKYGKTIIEVEKSGFKNIYPFINHDNIDHMDRNLAKTIDGFSHYILELKPDLIIVHGDRIEAMAGAIVGSLNNILVAHIEGGEVSGTIDELIRHSISKIAHIHLTSNEEARKRLIQMGEYETSIFTIGSPDLDIMNSKDLPTLNFVKEYYKIPFNKYAILMFHPVTTEIDKIKNQVKILVDCLESSSLNYIVIYPNNDMGSNFILEEYKRFENNPKFKIFPSLRFEYFLVLLKNSQFTIGNSSAGVREAPYYNIPTINVGNRQNNRVKSNTIISIDFIKEDIDNSIQEALKIGKIEKDVDFGDGNSDKKFYELLQNENFWHISNQKQFKDLY